MTVAFVILLGGCWVWPAYRHYTLIAEFHQRGIRVDPIEAEAGWLRRTLDEQRLDAAPWTFPFDNLLIRGGTEFTDEDIARCSGLSYVDSLLLNGNRRITSTGLLQLSNLNYLHTLELTGIELSDAELQIFKALPRLRVLRIGRTSISDAGLAILGRLENLSFLDVSETQITDAGLRQLYALENLQGVNISHTKATRDGVEQLKMARPGLCVAGP